jgi:hypothetical protein
MIWRAPFACRRKGPQEARRCVLRGWRAKSPLLPSLALPGPKKGAYQDMSSEPRGVDQRQSPGLVKGRVARAGGPLPLTRPGDWRRPRKRGFVDMSLVSAGVNAPLGGQRGGSP